MPSISIEEVRSLIAGLAKQSQNIWIAREVFRMKLITQLGMSPESIAAEEQAAIANPDFQKAARHAFRALWDALEEVGKGVVAEDFLLDPSASGKPN